MLKIRANSLLGVFTSVVKVFDVKCSNFRMASPKI